MKKSFQAKPASNKSVETLMMMTALLMTIRIRLADYVKKPELTRVPQVAVPTGWIVLVPTRRLMPMMMRPWMKRLSGNQMSLNEQQLPS